MRSPRDLAVGCNCRVWSGIRRLTALAALPKRVLGGREFPSVETLCTVPLARLWVPYHVRACAHQLHWRLLSHHGVSVGQRTLLGRGFYCAYEDSEQIEWPQGIGSQDERLGLSLSAQSPVDLSTQRN